MLAELGWDETWAALAAVHGPYRTPARVVRADTGHAKPERAVAWLRDRYDATAGRAAPPLEDDRAMRSRPRR